jgi:dTDP-4-dehydrorhamnose 3,5-epimerase
MKALVSKRLMEFAETKLKGAFIVSMKKIEDHRGFFARGWCREEFGLHGLNQNMVQLNSAFSCKRGTLRGLHFQQKPYEEAKFVRCTRGAIYDVIVDLRPDSPTRGQWIGVELTAENGVMMYVPEGFAHGYQTLADDTDMYYMTTALFAPGAARGIRHNEPLFGIDWPLPVLVISDQDRKWPDYHF